jgi:hypothetical protein
MADAVIFEKGLSRIADVLQVPLEYSDGKAFTNAVFNFEPLPDLNLPVKVKPVKVFMHDQVGVVFHLMGHLYLMVGHFEKTNSTTAFLINQAKLDIEGVMARPDMLLNSKGSLKEAVDALRPGIVKSFVWKGTRWEVLKLPK